ncbi:hypothetical protein FHR32_005461 [Streptosporangium album]|uniref:Uncharacterized protein n=1 Tax=Streptosporangium album TaxID=47479 RepID=A0A7W7WCB7_9ACTN|nr:hypothetical protein [Streptosporangium album]MBB4941084.1 hypothetical protein [Streptosporangium album]
MATQNNMIGRMTARPAVFVLLVVITGAITGLVLYSRAGLFGLTYGSVDARTPNSFYGFSVQDEEWAAQLARPGVMPNMSGRLGFHDPTPDTGQLIWQAMIFPGFVVAAGLGLLVLSGVLRDGVRMRDDLEGTV